MGMGGCLLGVAIEQKEGYYLLTYLLTSFWVDIWLQRRRVGVVLVYTVFKFNHSTPLFIGEGRERACAISE